MWRFIPFAFKNSMRNRRRTLLTILSISVSLFLLAMLMTVYIAFYHREAAPEQALRLATRHRVSLTFPLPEYYLARISQLPGVKHAYSASWYGGVYIDRKPLHNFPRFAVDPDGVFLVRPELQAPPDQLAAFQRERTAAAVGRTIADQLGFRLGQKITLQGDIYPGNLELTIRAIFEGENDGVMFFHRVYLQEGQPRGRQGWIGMVWSLAESPEAVPRLAAAIDEMFRNSPQQTKTESERGFYLSFLGMLGDVKLILVSISTAVTFAILLVAANTMAMSVRERIREVGVLKTLGFTTGTVLTMIVAEAAIIGLIGGLLGSLMAMGMSAAIGKMPLMFGADLRMRPAALLITLGVGCLIGVASSLAPALGASRMRITDALRHAG